MLLVEIVVALELLEEVFVEVDELSAEEFVLASVVSLTAVLAVVSTAVSLDVEGATVAFVDEVSV